MDTKTAFKALKDRIKDLSGRQRPLKRARKTTLPADERRIALEKAGMSPSTVPTEAAWEVSRRRAKITACLNLCHELRGSEHRHGPGDKWLYGKYDKELREEFLVGK